MEKSYILEKFSYNFVMSNNDINNKIQDLNDFLPNINNDIYHHLTYFSNGSSHVPTVMVITEGYEKCSSNKAIIGPEKYSYSIIHYVFSGSGYIEFENYRGEKEKKQVKAKEVFIIPPKVTFSYYPDKDDPWEYAWLSFNLDGNVETLSSIYDINQLVIKFKNHKNVERVFSKIRKLTEYNNGKDILAAAIFYEVMAEILENSKSNVYYSYRKDYINECIAFINKNYSNPDLKLEEIANHLHINKKYLSRIFSNAMNLTLFGYINYFRIKIACIKLSNTNDSIASIANDVGFSDSLYFSRKFKTIIGISPSKYKQYIEKQTKN